MRPASSTVLLARQPIIGRDHAIVAYELLYRSASERNAALIIDNALATADVVDAAFRRVGIDAVVGRTRALVNVDAEFLLSRRIERLPKESVMLELLETMDIDAQVVRRCRQLKERGYQLALDDVCHYSEKFEPLLEFVDVVKIDVLQLDSESLAKLVQRLRVWPARLLAEKVDTASRLKQCLELGIEWIQGFFCGRPMVLSA
jgi:c-di-GMP-related signal transduction protein